MNSWKGFGRTFIYFICLLPFVLSSSGEAQEQICNHAAFYRTDSVTTKSAVRTSASELPSSFRWDLMGGVTPSKHQTGSECWIFAAAAAIEASYKITYNVELDIAEQQISSCLEEGGCGPGNVDNAFNYWANVYGPIADSLMPGPDTNQWGTRVCTDTIPCIDYMYTPLCPSFDVASLPSNPTSDDIKMMLRRAPICTDLSTNHANLLVGWDDDTLGGCWRYKDHSPLEGDSGFYWSSYDFPIVNGGKIVIFEGQKVWVSDSRGVDSLGLEAGTYDHPFKTIAYALPYVYARDTLVLDTGSYSGSGNSHLSINNRITVMGIDSEHRSVIDLGDSTNGFTCVGNPKFVNLEFRNGRNGHSQFVGVASAGILVMGTEAGFSNCRFVNCVTENSGGAAIAIPCSSNVSIENSVFDSNSTYGSWQYGQRFGGAILASNASFVHIESCLFRENTAGSLPSGGGGAIAIATVTYCAASPTGRLEIYSSTFVNNSAGGVGYNDAGGAIFVRDSVQLLIGNNTFVGNSADSGAALYVRSSRGCDSVLKNIFYDNPGIGVYGKTPPSSFKFKYNALHETSLASGGKYTCTDALGSNLFMDPFFCNPDSGDFHLVVESPCTAANSPNGLQIGAFAAACTLGVHVIYNMSTDSVNILSELGGTLSWSSGGADSCEIWIDSVPWIPSCGQPVEYMGATGNNYFVTPNQNLTIGPWWFWRVRGFYDNEPGLWSDFRAFRFIDELPPSCPVLFVHDGDEFQEENPLLTECVTSNYKDIVTDFYHVRTPVNSRDGLVRLRLREMEKEVTYLNSLELLAVDHSPTSKVAASVDGRIALYQQSVAPLSAVDDRGVDRLGDVVSEDGRLFESSAPGYLVLTFPGTIGRGNWLDITTGIKGHCSKVVARPESPGIVRVERMTANGAWEAMAVIPPREDQIQSAVFVGQETNDGTITIRLSWESGFSTDVIRQYLPLEEEPILTQVAPRQLLLTSAGYSGQANPLTSAAGVTVLRCGDVLDGTFELPTLATGKTRDYVVKAVGRYEPEVSESSSLPTGFALGNAYPNPFNPATTISFSTPIRSRVKLEVMNVLGQVVTTLLDDSVDAGEHEVTWDGSNAASGVYFYRLTTDGYYATKKMVLLK